MLLERNQAVIGFIVAVLVALGTVFAVGATGGFFVPGDRFEVDFVDAAGLEPGNFVFIAGVRVGQVVDVELRPDRVHVVFSSTAPKFPADSSADIIIANTLGKRAIRINAGTSTEDFAVGDTIAMELTSTPIDIPELGDRSAELLTELDVEALQELTSALADVADTSSEDLQRLLVGLEDVSTIIVDRRTDLERLLTQGAGLIDAVVEVDDDIIRIIDAFGSTLDRLDGRRGDIQRLLNETVNVTDTASDLLLDRKTQINDLLADLHTDLEIVDAHQGDLSHAFAYAGVAIEGFASIGYEGGELKRDTRLWGNVFLTDLGPAGVNAVFGCGGSLDAVFTGLVGPDPRCPAEGEAAEAASAGVITPSSLVDAQQRRARVGAFFEIGATR